ncbi:AAA family ATPase [Pseudomonas guariconensis]|uniref:ATP-dependent nuclease n=1 Tax=Pseudomonas TaxID=286 RepID=UPI0020974F9A|nr:MULTISPECIES: AAA family ATPase [Pseudomonas]MCO7515744.1 AAA family ATPase [Pseudomonas putida]MCO7605664.1 AAA family ATPase [Pseudomonas guariconensis]
MTDNEAIAGLVETLEKFKPGKPLKSYITHARFPKFKGIEPGTQIDFNFPLTALVGANGIGKSSILHALWGMPFGYTTSKFWFATELDPIEGSRKDPQRYVYGHWNESYNGIVETRKARLGSKEDYWEPYRRSEADGMPPIPPEKYDGKSKDRWNPVRRKVVYINFKMTFGSFDRYFYTDEGGDHNRSSMKLEATRLKRIIAENRQSYKHGPRQKLFENRPLTEEELFHVSNILGREYKSAQLVRHSLYPGNRGQDMSVVFKRGLEYSEAFAGSGEIAAVSAVVQLLAAEKYSLILLDEPETSLHPGAQRALLKFLLEQIKLKYHQIVISTHSSDFLEGLPASAIKVLEDNGQQQTRALPHCSPYAALHRLGRQQPKTRRILVEDPLAEQIIMQAAKGLDIGDQQAIEIKIAPGGAESILKYHIPSAITSGDDIFVYLDGDKKKVEAFTDPSTVPPADYYQLENLLKNEFGCAPHFLIPGGSGVEHNKAAKARSQLGYLDWASNRLAYLPKRCPEQILLDAQAPEIGATCKNAQDAKTKLRNFLTQGVIELPQSEMIVLEKLSTAKLPNNNNDLETIRRQLKLWLNHVK